VAVVCGVALSLAGCAGQEQSGSPATRVATWVDGAGAGGSIGAVGDDLHSVEVALDQHQSAGVLRTLCAVLGTDALAGNGNLVTPDQQLTDDLSTAYDAAYSAGDDCYRGAGGNAELLAEFRSQQAKATAALAAAMARIQTVTGKVPSTTTTTAPAGTSGDPFSGT